MFHGPDVTAMKSGERGWHAIGEQLRHPEGAGGRIIGCLMRVLNSRANALAVQALDARPGETILELGFGPGHAIRLLTKRAPEARIYGVDQSKLMVDLARERNADAIRAGRVHLHEGTFNQIPLSDATVDKILAVNVIYFWDRSSVLNEIRRVLRPEGLITIYATDAAVMKNWKFAATGTHRIFGAADILSFLRQGGFAHDEIHVRKISAAPGISGLLTTIRVHRGSEIGR